MRTRTRVAGASERARLDLVVHLWVAGGLIAIVGGAVAAVRTGSNAPWVISWVTVSAAALVAAPPRFRVATALTSIAGFALLGRSMASAGLSDPDLWSLVALSSLSIMAVLRCAAFFSGARSQRDLEKIAKTLTGADVPTTQAAAAACEREIRRARRTEMPLSLVSMELRPGKVQDIQTDPPTRLEQWFQLMDVAVRLSKQSKEFDLFFRDEDRLLILLPHQDREHALLAAGRFSEIVKNEVGMTTTTRVASFPLDALHFDQLLAAATDDSVRLRTPIARAPGRPLSGGSHTSRRGD